MRGAAPDVDFVRRRSANPPLRPLQITGRDRTRLMIPPAATAPAPMYSTYAFWICDTDMSLIRCAVSGESGTVQPLPKNLIAGIKTRYESTPPAAIMQEI